MTAPVAIDIVDLSKKFARSLRRAMVYGLSDITRAALIPRRHRSDGLDARLADARRPSNMAVSGSVGRAALGEALDTTGLRPTEFWALRRVNLRLLKGESVGLIGANGAGKSTLFSVLSGIYSPSEGRVEMQGRLQALIALGAGFHPALSGRENIYINAAILGLTGKQVDAVMDEIVDFADIGDFLDAPVKNYSSGMLVRLGFSIAAHMDPDNLLIDEVLAVGDASFQLKCARYSRDLIESGKTLMVVSHNMLIIQMMCQRVVWMDRGRVIEDGPTQQVIENYKRYMLSKAAAQTDLDEGREKNLLAMIRDVYWIDEQGGRVATPVSGAPCTVCMEVQAVRDIDCARVWLVVGVLGAEHSILGASMFEDGHYLSLSKGLNTIKLRFKQLQLRPGPLYRLATGLRDWAGNIMLTDSFATDAFEVSEGGAVCLNGVGEAPRLGGTMETLVNAPYEWRVESGAHLKSDAHAGRG